MNKILLLLFFIFYSYIHANTYELYIASTKYKNVAKQYIEEVNDILKIENLIIRTHEKKNYSLIVKDIKTIQEAKKLKYILKTNSTYKDSFIKKITVKPTYSILYETKMMSNNKTFVKKKDDDKIYKHEVEASNEYITASIMFNTEQYQESYKMFYELFLKHNDNLNINYFLARSAFSLKKYTEAVAVYKKVLILDPTYNQARYDYARILYLLKQKAKAKEEFNILLEKNIKEEIKIKIKEFLKVLNKEDKAIEGTAQIAIGFSRSSNVNNGLMTQEFSPGYFGEKPITDSAIYEVANLNLFNYIKNQPIRIQNSFLAYNKTYFKERDTDIIALSYKPSITYYDAQRQQSYSLEVAADKIIRRTNEDLYAFSISPKLYEKDLYAYLKYQRILYKSEENKDKDFEKFEFYANVNLLKNISYYTNLYKNRRIKNSRIDIDKYTISNGINIFYNFTKDDKVNLNYQFDFSKYDYESFAFNSRREDKRHFVELSYNHIFDKLETINISTSYMKNYSNQKLYMYEEKEIKLNYSKAFKW